MRPRRRQRWAPPNGGRGCLVRYATLELVDAERRVLRVIERDADGRWLHEVCGADVAADGSMAAASWFGARVAVFSAEGEPRSSFRPPGRPAMRWWLRVADRIFRGVAQRSMVRPPS